MFRRWSRRRSWWRWDCLRARSWFTSEDGICCVPLVVITVSVAGFAVARVVLWPDSLPLRVALEVSYQIILVTAAIALLRARKGRWELGAWLLASCLLVQHLDWPPFTNQIPRELCVVADVLLGLSMLLIVFGEARARDRRLKVLRALTESIVLAQQQGGMMEDSLGELQRLTKSKAAWFRLIEGGHLVATHAVGVSSDFLAGSGFCGVDGECLADAGAGQAGGGARRVKRVRKMRDC